MESNKIICHCTNDQCNNCTIDELGPGQTFKLNLIFSNIVNIYNTGWYTGWAQHEFCCMTVVLSRNLGGSATPWRI